MDPGLSNLVISISAGVTAAATVAIALLTLGTMKLYQLEKTRRDAEGARLAAVLGRFEAGAEGMLSVSKKPIDLPPNLDALRERLARWVRDVDTAWHYAAELGLPGVMANLHCAEVRLDYLRDDMAWIEGIEHSGGPNSLEKIEDILRGPFLKHLEHMVAFVEGANESLPVAMRDLGGKTYLEHLNTALSRVLQPAAGDEAEVD